MFKIVDKPRAWWPVAFKGVAEDGSVITNKIQVRFIIFNEDENLELQKTLMQIENGEGPKDKMSIGEMGADILQRIAEDWKDVGEEDGSPEGKSLPFTRENMERLCRVPNVLRQICLSYADCRAGEIGVRAGN